MASRVDEPEAASRKWSGGDGEAKWLLTSSSFFLFFEREGDF
jgi:hypothetical protein